MIHDNGNGTETVTLYTDRSGRLAVFGSTAFKAVSVTVNNQFPTYAANNGATQDVLGSQKEIWVQVLEKAAATLGGGYGSIAYGGSPVLAMEELTGHAASYLSPKNLTLSSLLSHAAAGDLMVMDTFALSNLPFGLVGNHAYMFEGVTTVNGAAMVKLGNPWGFAQPALIPFDQLSKGIVEVDCCHV
jgi:hypothetical protein